MKISELDIKGLRGTGLTSRTSISPLPGDEKSVYGDIRDYAIGNKLGSYAREKNQKLTSPNIEVNKSSETDDFTYRGYPIQLSDLVKKFISDFKSDCDSREYDFSIANSYHGPGAGTRTKINNIVITFALNQGQNLPKTFRVDVPTGKDVEETKKKSELLIKGLEEYGYNYTIGKDKKIAINLPSKLDVEKTLEYFWQVVDSVESMGEDFTKRQSSPKSNSSKKSITRKSTPLRYYLGAASLIYIGARFGLMNILPRGGGEKSTSTFDINDNLIVHGYSEEAAQLMQGGRGSWSKENNDGIWREHAVPCDLIVKKGIEMVKEKKSKDLIDQDLIIEIAKMIQRNLIIVWITKNQADVIDHELGFETTMPQGDGWDPFNDDPLSRFQAANIKIYQADSGVRLRENNLSRRS